MNKLFQFVIVALVAVAAPVVVTMPVSAQSMDECVISETGEDSNNQCEAEYTCEIDVENNNTVTIINSNSGTAASGNASAQGNGTAGNAISGTASNGSNATFNVVITNGEGDDPDTCEVVDVVPVPEPETPVTPPVQPAQKVTPKALPVTSGSIAPIVVTSLAGLAALAGVVAAYRRFL